MRISIAPKWVIGALCLASPPMLRAADGCWGSPFVNLMNPRAIEESAGAAVGPQIFDVAVHPRGFVLMGNNNGLLIYDGVGWRLRSLGRSAAALSVAVGPDGRMFAGGSRTFGEVVEDPTGQLIYQSLESRLPARDRGFSDVWQTLVSPEGLAYFRTPERLVIVNGGDTQAIAPAGRFTAAALAFGLLYANDSGTGIVGVDNKAARLVKGGEAFKGVPVTVIAEGPARSLLIATQDRGLFRFDLTTGEAKRLDSAAIGLQASEILSVRRMPDGQIAVGTLRRGLFVLDESGRLRLHMDSDSGLPDNAVLTLQEANGSLWAGTSGGVAQLLMPSPVESFGAKRGLPGIVEALVRAQGTVYASTSQGVFRMSCGEQAFEPLPALRKQSFALLSAGGLLAATADGIYEIHGAEARLVRPGLARGFAASKDHDRVWAATQAGVAALSKKGGRWLADSPLLVRAAGDPKDAVQDVEATSVGEDVDGRVWASLVTGGVISGLPMLKGGRIELADLRSFGGAEGVSSPFAEVISLVDGVRIGLGASVLRPVGDRLVPDGPFTRTLGPAQGAFRIKPALDGGYWVASAKRPLRLVKGAASSALSIRSTSLLRTPAGSRVLDFLEVSPREVWIGTDDGAFRYNPSAEVDRRGEITAQVRRVQSNQSDLFWGGPSDTLEAELPHLAPLRFEVASSSLDDPSRNRFRFRLDGQDNEWSPWTAETRKDYTNLGPGAYRFRVETQDVYDRLGKEAGFSFVVSAPWYRKAWAIGLALVAGTGLFFLALHLRTRALQNRQRELERIVDQKTAELREASFTDPLTGLHNRRYFAEVIAGEVALASRPGSHALHLFLVDLDHFKQINDTHGHGAGDEVLRQVAVRLKSATRNSDLIFRWGGEEFLIVARGAADLPRSEIARRIVFMVGAKPFEVGAGISLARTCSLGFATFPFFSENSGKVPADAALELADLALYRAKHTGRNRAIGVSAQIGGIVPGEAWKNQSLEDLERGLVSVEVIEGPQVPSS